eukprot:jgi/Mesvir1/12373/Mv00554-RA.1
MRADMAAVESPMAAKAVAFLVLFSSLACVAHGVVLGIDFGGEYMKISIVKPGRAPISIVTNEVSRRKTPVAVAFHGQERFLGETADALKVRYPSKVFFRMRDLLGQDFGSDVMNGFKDSYLPYSFVEIDAEEGKVLGLKMEDTGAEYRPEEMVAMILQHAKELGEEYSHMSVKDAVITVPPFFGQRQRQALVSAAQIAGLNVLSLIGEHAAAALQFGMDRDFSNKSENVLLFDMGSHSTYAALLKYSTFNGKEAGKTKAYNQVEVRGLRWDATLGADALDLRLVDHFAKEFNKKLGDGRDVRDYPKAVSKLKMEARRCKEILSANNEAPFNVESLFEDRDFSSSISRETFVGLWADLKDRVATPIQRVLADTGVTVEELNYVELLGGGSRVPAVIEMVSAALGGRALDRHLDSDEAIALGAGLHAANLSTVFRVRKFGLTEGAAYPLGVRIPSADADAEAAEEDASDKADAKDGGEEPDNDADGGDDAEEETAGGDVGSSKNGDVFKSLLRRMAKFPAKRNVSLRKRRTDFSLSLQYDLAAEGAEMPPGVADPLFATVHVKGLPAVAQRFNSTGKVNVHFVVNKAGVLTADRAEVLVVLPDLPPPEAKKKGANATTGAAAGKNATQDTADSQAGDASNSPTEDDGSNQKGSAPDQDKEDKEEEDSAKGEEADGKDGSKDADDGGKGEGKGSAEEASGERAGSGKEEDKAGAAKPKGKPKPRTARMPLDVEVVAVGTLSPKSIRAAEKTLRLLKEKDLERKRTDEAKNALESYIYANKERMEEGAEGAEDLVKVTTPEQREKFTTELADAEDWLYMGDGESATGSAFEAKLKQLRGLGDPIMTRVEQLTARPEAVALAREFLQLARARVAAWNDTKPWLNETDVAALLEAMAEYEAWLDEMISQQEAAEAHAAPVFLADDLAAKRRPLEKRLMALDSTPKPKPKTAKAKKPKAKVVIGDKNATAGNETEVGLSWRGLRLVGTHV